MCAESLIGYHNRSSSSPTIFNPLMDINIYQIFFIGYCLELSLSNYFQSLVWFRRSIVPRWSYRLFNISCVSMYRVCYPSIDLSPCNVLSPFPFQSPISLFDVKNFHLNSDSGSYFSLLLLLIPSIHISILRCAVCNLCTTRFISVQKLVLTKRTD